MAGSPPADDRPYPREVASKALQHLFDGSHSHLELTLGNILVLFPHDQSMANAKWVLGANSFCCVCTVIIEFFCVAKAILQTLPYNEQLSEGACQNLPLSSPQDGQGPASRPAKHLVHRGAGARCGNVSAPPSPTSPQPLALPKGGGGEVRKHGKAT